MSTVLAQVGLYPIADGQPAAYGATLRQNQRRNNESTSMKSKTLIPLFVVVALWPLTITNWTQAQPATVLSPKPSVQIFPETSDLPQAVVLSVNGKCNYSEDGKMFAPLKAKQVLKQGAVVRTGEGARTDLFFRRIGTTVRLQSGTEVKLEKMDRHLKDGKPVMETLLDLRTGRIFTVVRALVPGSTFAIRNAAGRSVVEGGGGKGRYIITADGTHVAEKGSVVPLKVIGETGITVISSGMKFSAKDGKLFSLTPPEAVESLIVFDNLDSLAEETTPSEEPPKEK
ncbi:MAG: hypothetical protein HZA90_19990 [Verrucomicrobia bacterium]|nr:hypothetical protein [Verrucomicrobiota bacterium]